MERVATADPAVVHAPIKDRLGIEAAFAETVRPEPTPGSILGMDADVTRTTLLPPSLIQRVVGTTGTAPMEQDSARRWRISHLTSGGQP